MSRAVAAALVSLALTHAGYLESCATCHGPDGRGAPGMPPEFAALLPDFTDCSFATREPDVDRMAVSHGGGPARAFSPIMPA